MEDEELQRGLRAEKEWEKRETLLLSNGIVQFQHLSSDIRSSGWISGKIRKGEVFFPCHRKRLKLQNLFANPVTAVLLLICPSFRITQVSYMLGARLL